MQARFPFHHCARYFVCFVLISHAIESRAADAPPFLEVVRGYADAMIDHGRDVYGPEKSGLFLSALDRETLKPLTVRPSPPAGIRREDRPGRPWSALTGANPQLDQNLLRLLYSLTEVTGDRRYALAADEALSWFLTRTQSAATGLYPWGEHLSWDVLLDRVIAGGNDFVHEFARPWVLWDRCFALAPEPSRKFALGLWEHQIANHETGAFDRHAPYFQSGPREGKDFARHAGFYIGTWASAYAHTKDEVYAKAITVLLDRYEKKRQASGALSIGPLDCAEAAQHVSEPLASRLRAFAEAEDEFLLRELRRQMGLEAAAPANAPAGAPAKWRSVYGVSTLANSAMLAVARYQQTPRPEYQEIIVAAADAYLSSRPEEDTDAWPMSFAHAISLEVAAFKLTARPVYLDQAREFAQRAVDAYWQDNPLPRASLKTGHYEAITGADSLGLALLEVHAALHNLPQRIPSNTIDR